MPALSTARRQAVHVTYTFNSFEPSTATRVLFPTISVGKTRSSRIFSCTDVSVRERGLFCLVRELRVGLLSIRRWATKTTCLSENFFSSSRVSLWYPNSGWRSAPARTHTPWLDFAERLQLWNWDKDDDSFLATSDVNFAGSRNLQGTELGLELGDVVLQVDKGLGETCFGLIRRCLGSVGGTRDLVVDGHDGLWVSYSQHPVTQVNIHRIRAFLAPHIPRQAHTTTLRGADRV